MQANEIYWNTLYKPNVWKQANGLQKYFKSQLSQNILLSQFPNNQNIFINIWLISSGKVGYIV